MAQLRYFPRAAFAALLRADLPAAKRNPLFADMCRGNILYMIAKAGSGHIGSSFSSIDIVTRIFLDELRPGSAHAQFPFHDVYFSSKGHDAPGLYAVLIALGRLSEDKLHAFRRLGGLPGHPDVVIPGCAANTGSLGMGISKAKGMALAARLDKIERKFLVMTGDGELQEGQIWESLQGAANRNLGEITLIVDNNKIQSDIWVAQTSDNGDIEGKFLAFGWRTLRVDGHNDQALSVAFAQCGKAGDAPLAIIADTCKGSGVSFMEHTAPTGDRGLYKYHSGAPSETDYNDALKELFDRIEEQTTALNLPSPGIATQQHTFPSSSGEKFERLPSAYGKTILEAALRDDTLVVLDADLKLDCGIIPFEERFPERFIECGIAEQDMVSMAGGLALAGKLPVCHSFSSFLSSRANEQIYNNASEKRKILYAGFLSGVVPAPPGHSHQSVRDISSLGAIPGLVLFEPSCAEEMRQAVLFFTDTSWTQSAWLRITSIPVAVTFSLPAGYQLQEGCGCVLAEGEDVAILTYGPVMLGEAVKAVEELRTQGLRPKLINHPWLNRLDPQWFDEALDGVEHLLVVDNHYLRHGVGEMVLAAAQRRPPLAVRLLGLTDIPPCGQNAEIVESLGLNSRNMVQSIQHLRQYGRKS
jgi:transketolase